MIRLGRLEPYVRISSEWSNFVVHSLVMATKWPGKSARSLATCINLFKAICYLLTTVLQRSIHVVDELEICCGTCPTILFPMMTATASPNVRRPVVLVLVLAVDNAFLTHRRDLSGILQTHVQNSKSTLPNF